MLYYWSLFIAVSRIVDDPPGAHTITVNVPIYVELSGEYIQIFGTNGPSVHRIFMLLTAEKLASVNPCTSRVHLGHHPFVVLNLRLEAVNP